MASLNEKQVVRRPLVRIDGVPFVGGSVNGDSVYYRRWRFDDAVCKALGMGCAGSLFEVPVAFGQPVALCHPYGDEFVCVNVVYDLGLALGAAS